MEEVRVLLGFCFGDGVRRAGNRTFCLCNFFCLWTIATMSFVLFDVECGICVLCRMVSQNALLFLPCKV